MSGAIEVSVQLVDEVDIPSALIPGPPGKGAYEQWLAAGNVGSTAAFFASLHGRDGKDGVDGADGQDGQDGQDGADGQPGQPGRDGTDGQNGADGPPGPPGTGVPPDGAVTLAKLAASVFATPQEVAAGVGSGVATVSSVADELDVLRVGIGVGALMTSNPGPRFLRADGRRYLKTAYPKLAANYLPIVSLKRQLLTSTNTDFYVYQSNRTVAVSGSIYTVYSPDSSIYYFVKITPSTATFTIERFSMGGPGNNSEFLSIIQTSANTVAAYIRVGTNATYVYSINTDTNAVQNIGVIQYPSTGNVAQVLKSQGGKYYKTLTNLPNGSPRLYRSSSPGDTGTAVSAVGNAVIRSMVEYEPGKIAIAVTNDQNNPGILIYKTVDDGLSWALVGTYPEAGNAGEYTLMAFGGKVYASYLTPSVGYGFSLINMSTGAATYLFGASPQPGPIFAGMRLFYGDNPSPGVLSPDGVFRGRSALVGEGAPGLPSNYSLLASASICQIGSDAYAIQSSSQIYKFSMTYDPATEIMMPISADEIYVRTA